MTTSFVRRRSGQSLAEFALVIPLFMLFLGAIVQGAILFWGQNTLQQVTADTARWAVTRQTCNDPQLVVDKANQIAGASSLVGYAPTSWTTANVVVTWPPGTGAHAADSCPPQGNQQERFVSISITHTVPVFFPLFGGNVTARVESRMEPAPAAGS